MFPRSLWFFAIAILTLPSGYANAAAKTDDLHAEICTNAGIVSKDKLLVHLLRTHPGAMEALLLYPPKGRQESGKELIRALLSESNSCTKRNSCGDDADGAMRRLRIGFNSFLDEGVANKTYSGLDPLTPASVYFQGPDSGHAIRCAGTPDLVVTPDDTKDKSPLRIRGNTGDLVYDRNKNKNDFKSASAAKINYTDDRSSGKKFTTKVKSVLGFAYKTTDTATLSDQIIPYVSVNQTVTDAEGQPRKLDDSNYVAAGILFDRIYTPNATLGHRISAMPQFLYNSKDTSEIASVLLTYQPWTYFASSDGSTPFNINTANVFGDPRSLVKAIFDLRSDNGYYTRKGNINDPNLHTSFFRIGSQFGLAWTLVDYSLTLKVTETLLYGYYGTARKLDYFDASISYDLDPSGYFSLSLGYQKGRDLETTNPVQTWTVGLTAKY